MIQVSKEYFDSIFPELEKIYNHSNKTCKLWERTIRKKMIVKNIDEKISQYWRTGTVTP